MGTRTRLNWKRGTRPAGLRKAHFKTYGGVTVHVASVYDGRAQGMDTYAGRWQAVCELHGGICSCETLALACSAALETESFCEDCRRRADGDELLDFPSE